MDPLLSGRIERLLKIYELPGVSSTLKSRSAVAQIIRYALWRYHTVYEEVLGQIMLICLVNINTVPIVDTDRDAPESARLT